MKTEVERRKPESFLDYLSLAITTVGVGYIPGAPGTYGSIVGVAIYLEIVRLIGQLSDRITLHDPKFDAYNAALPASLFLLLLLLCLLGMWASGRSIPLLGNSDPSQAVIDEVMGQLVVFLFVPIILVLPLGMSWPFVLAGFLLFRLFDIWKPYPINQLQDLPGGLGICADDLVAGVYAGVCLAVIYAIYLSI